MPKKSAKPLSEASEINRTSRSVFRATAVATTWPLAGAKQIADRKIGHQSTPAINLGGGTSVKALSLAQGPQGHS